MLARQLAPILGGVFATYLYQFAFATTWGESLTSQYRDDDDVLFNIYAHPSILFIHILVELQNIYVFWLIFMFLFP